MWPSASPPKIIKETINMKSEMKKDKYVTYTVFTREIKNLATKDDTGRIAEVLIRHDRQFEKIAEVLMRHDRQFEQIQETLASNHRDILNRFDDYAQKFKFFDNRQVFNTGRLNELDPVIKNHEERIVALETKQTQTAP